MLKTVISSCHPKQASPSRALVESLFGEGELVEDNGLLPLSELWLSDDPGIKQNSTQAVFTPEKDHPSEMLRRAETRGFCLRFTTTLLKL